MPPKLLEKIPDVNKICTYAGLTPFQLKVEAILLQGETNNLSLEIKSLKNQILHMEKELRQKCYANII